MQGPAGRKLTRRQALMAAGVIAGGLALPVLAAAPVSDNSLLLQLGRELDRVRRRTTRLHRKVRHLAARAELVLEQSGGEDGGSDLDRRKRLDLIRKQLGYDQAWQTWSSAVDLSLDLAASIRRIPATDLAGFAVKHQALVWELFSHELAIGSAESQLRLIGKFGRELQRAAELATV